MSLPPNSTVHMDLGSGLQQGSGMRFKQLKGSVRAWYATNSLQLAIWVHGFRPSVVGKRWGGARETCPIQGFHVHGSGHFGGNLT